MRSRHTSPSSLVSWQLRYRSIRSPVGVTDVKVPSHTPTMRVRRSLSLLTLNYPAIATQVIAMISTQIAYTNHTVRRDPAVRAASRSGVEP